MALLIMAYLKSKKNLPELWCKFHETALSSFFFFFQVFDGHGGKDAASFTRENILKFITEDSHFPDGVKRALKNAFVRTDHALADHKNLDRSSGTTAITALILGRYEFELLMTKLLVLLQLNNRHQLFSQKGI